MVLPLQSDGLRPFRVDPLPFEVVRVGWHTFKGTCSTDVTSSHYPEPGSWLSARALSAALKASRQVPPQQT